MAEAPSIKAWLITGASQGLGLAIALSALKAGHRVIAGARSPETAVKAHPELEAAGGKWIQLDVDSTETTGIVTKAAEDAGGIDVIVNNAGYIMTGTIEDLDEEEMQRAMNTNFWGAIRVIKGVLPSMRARKSGTIISISSVFAVYPCAAGALYSCPKAAHDMLQEVLSQELASFNIRTVIINAGLYKTSVLRSAKLPSKGFGEHYLTSPVGQVLGVVGKYAQEPDEHMPGDPAKFGDRIVEIADSTGLGEGLEKHSRVFLGRDSIKLSDITIKENLQALEASKTIAASTDFEGHVGEGVGVVSDFFNKKT